MIIQKPLAKSNTQRRIIYGRGTKPWAKLWWEFGFMSHHFPTVYHHLEKVNGWLEHWEEPSSQW